METCTFAERNTLCNLAVTREAWLSPLSSARPFKVLFCDMHLDLTKKDYHNIFDTYDEALSNQVTRKLT